MGSQAKMQVTSGQLVCKHRDILDVHVRIKPQLCSAGVKSLVWYSR